MSRILSCILQLSSLEWERGIIDFDMDSDHSGFI